MTKVSFIFYSLLLSVLLSKNLFSQTTNFNQFNYEVQFNKVLGERWALELDLGEVFSNTPNESKVLNTPVQGYGLLWGHFFASPRWKITTSLFYYYNFNVPEIGQYQSQEYRPGIQGIYYINKVGYTLLSRQRGEMRIQSNEDGNYEVSYRYRQMLKYVQPINQQVLRKGVFYAIVQEELFFRTKHKSSGFHYFDRNILTIGPGYMITDDLQIELNYMHEFVPRDNGNTLNNVFAVTLVTNNMITKLAEKVNEMITPDEPE